MGLDHAPVGQRLLERLVGRHHVAQVDHVEHLVNEAVRRRDHREPAGRTGPCVLAGPTCDSIDVLYEKQPYALPVSLEIGAKVLIEGTGAYTTTYSAVGFNGFPPLETHVI